MTIPLRIRLTALYAFVLGGVLVVASVLLVRSVRSTLLDTLDRELAVRASSIAAVVEADSGHWTIDPKSGLAETYAGDRSHYYVVRDPEHRVLVESPDAPRTDAGASPNGSPREFTAGGRRWRARELAVTKPADDEEKIGPTPLLVTCGKDLEAVDLPILSLQSELWLLCPSVLVASLALGYWLATRALRPVAVITAVAAEISEKQLHRRLPVADRDELGTLAVTLNSMFDRLESAFETRSRFTADASHELRTPLAVILGNAEFATKRERSADELEELMRDIAGAAQRMRDTVEGLLTLARGDSRALALQRETMPLAPLVAEVVRTLAPLAQQHGVTIVTRIGAEDVTGDRARISEALTNLVDNAIRYNRVGGSVTVSAEQAGERVRIRVEDTGIGIPDDALPKVFDRFFRVDGARSRESGGTGLGLAIVKTIVEAHGGSISVTSRHGVGSQFVIVV